MVGTLVRLQLTLFWRGVRGNVGKLIALVVGGLYLAAMVAAALAGEVVLRRLALPVAGGTLVLGLSLVTLTWPFVTLLVAGVDQTLDPGRFALLPVRARDLLPGLLVAGSLTLGGVATSVVVLGSLLTWSAWPVALPAAVVAVVVGLATCLVMSRAVAAVFSSAINSRRYRDSAAVVLALVGLTIGLGIQAVSRYVTDNPTTLAQQATRAGGVAGWTPLGWAWSLPWEAAQGRWVVLVVKLVLAAGLLVVLGLVWERHLARALVSPLEAGGDGTKVGSHTVAERLVPRGPVGAVASRTLRYWRRDPRHLVLLVSIVLLPLLMVAPALITPEQVEVNGQAGFGSAVLVTPVAAILLMTALTVAGEINLDGPALWMPVSAGVSGRDDRLGRLLGVGWVLVPMALATMLGFLAWTGRWDLAPALLGAGLSSLWAGAAVGSVAGAVWQWPTPAPGQNAFARSSGGGAISLLSTLVCLVGSGVVAAPALGVALLAADRPEWGWLSLLLALVVYPLLLWGAVVLSGHLLDRRWPEVLARVSAPVG